MADDEKRNGANHAVSHIGQSQLVAPPLALGTASFGWSVSPATSWALLDEFVALGGGLIDTASSYASGVSEQTIGSWMRERGTRDRVLIATKVGRGPEALGLSDHSIRTQVDASLTRLQSEVIDLLYFHAEDPDVPLGESLSVVDELIREGKVRALGASNFSLGTLLEARILTASGLPRIDAIAWEYSLLRRDIAEGDAAVFLADQHTSLMPYFVLAHGYLGDRRSVSSHAKNPDTRTRRAMSHVNRKSQSLIKILDGIALDVGADISTVALAWVLHQENVAVASIGPDNTDQLRALWSATTLSLTRSQLGELQRASG